MLTTTQDNEEIIERVAALDCCPALKMPMSEAL